jgi:hypothetical protein
MTRRQVEARIAQDFLTKFARGVCPTVASRFLAPGVASGAKREMGISLLLIDSRYDIE